MNLKTIKHDFLSSVVVTLVAIPLCLGIALASGVPLFAGILSGIIGGIVVGMISQSSFSVSGPAAGMIAVVITCIAQLGGYQYFLLALIVAGVIQLLCGIFRAGFIANFVPTNVIQGLLAAIGILIIIKQIPLAFGYYADPVVLHHSLESAEEILNLPTLFTIFHHINISAMIITFASLIILFCWDKFLPRVAKFIPAAVTVVIFSVALNAIFKFIDPKLALGSSHLVQLPINKTFEQLLLQFKHPDFSAWKNINIYFYGAMIAIIASLESLLNLEAIEKLDDKHHYCSRNRELLAQGIGNIAAGLLGGLPVTSVIVRSSVNINAGAKSKLSTIFHGIFLLLSVTLLSETLNYIPLAALAAILIYTGYKLANVALFQNAYQEGARYFIPFAITTIAIVISNLLTGILIGLTVSILFILHHNSKNGFTLVNENHTFGKIIRLLLPQQVTFLNKAAIVSELNRIPNNAKVIIDAKSTDYIDNDILGVIMEFKDRQAKDKNILLNLVGFQDHYDIKNETKFINATTYDVQTTLTPDVALRILREGNKRFINGEPIHKDYKQQIIATSKSQHPIAVVLSCIDSRVPVELIFDVTLGDLFVVRIAGNIANPDIVGSIEFACDIAKAKLIVVLGHIGCGAIKAACENFQLGNLTQLVDKIKPAIKMETAVNPHFSITDEHAIQNITRNNVNLTKDYLYKKSDVLRNLIDAEQVKMVGAVYNIHTGIVEFEGIPQNDLMYLMADEEIPAIPVQ